MNARQRRHPGRPRQAHPVTGRRGPAGVPAWGLALTAMLSVQLGSALSVHLISQVGAAGTAWLRLSLGAVIFWALARPPLRAVRRCDLPLLLGLGVTTGLQTIAFLAAIQRIPLGTSVAIEFLGPVTVAAGRTHHRRALAWPALALFGVLRDNVSPCNKRRPGTGCAALEGLNRGHAILGTSERCIATHPSDVAVALVAFDAIVHTVGPSGSREIAIDDFYLLPGDTPEVEHPLEHGELIVAIELPPLDVARSSRYLKFRDRQSYEFALVSVAAAVEVRDGAIAEARLALGGVGTKPWRARRAEAELLGTPATSERFALAAAAELEGADARAHNAFKVELAKRALVRGLTNAMNGGVR